MKTNYRSICGIFLSCWLLAGNLFALEYDMRGQLSGWTHESGSRDEWQNQSGLRYIPQMRLEQMLTDESWIDLEVSANGVVAYQSESSEVDADLDLYRLTLRLATAQTETRVGLQKINFGPARLLRALRWFDQLDQRDPQQLTEGVYATLFRYTARNNANMWLWGLYGNDEPKGVERLLSVKDKLEVGGRLQYPAFTGELAATVHTRIVDGSILNIDEFRETRVALDGRWEYGVGLWFESMVQRQESSSLPYEWTMLNTVGVDYTFGIGNGLYLIVEHMLSGASEKPFGRDEGTQVSACMLSYPIGLFDSLSAIGFYDWERQEYSQHLSWQRAYDNLTIDVSVFRSPVRENPESQGRQQAGYGGQLMLMYYH